MKGGLWWLHLAVYVAFGVVCSVVGINAVDRPLAFFALIGLFLANDIISSVRARG